MGQLHNQIRVVAMEEINMTFIAQKSTVVEFSSYNCYNYFPLSLEIPPIASLLETSSFLQW
jgi:hypothetical protein